MQTTRAPIWKRFFLAGLFGVIHSAIVVYVIAAVRSSTDPEAAMGLDLFDFLDYPLYPLFQIENLFLFGGIVFLAGGFLWFCCGALLQSLIFIRRPGNRLRLAISVILVGCILMIPTIWLAMKPPWEANWIRAWQIGRGQGADSARAVRYVTEAIRLSPKDNSQLPTLWEYLGSLYMDQKNYPMAEAVYRNRLTLVQAQPSPNPKELLNGYSALEMVYFWSGNIQGRKDSIEKMLPLCRTVYGGDSIQEAGAWQDLAKITHDAGDPKGAAIMLRRAITMYTGLHNEDVPYDYLNRTVAKWQTE
jgi:hypothetical protein